MDQIETVEFVKKYLEDLLTFFDLNLEVSVKIEDGIVVASIPHSERSSILIGRNAETLRSIQNLLSTALRHKEASTVRLIWILQTIKSSTLKKLPKRRAAGLRKFDELVNQRWWI